MTMNKQGRPSAPGTVEDNELPTISGDRGLDHEEGLIFELGRAGMTGVDVPDVQMSETRLGGQRRRGPIGLPGLSEPEVVRHYVRLSRMNYAIDAGLYPLGSCTMKHNPRLNEKMARLPGFGDVHPLQPQQTVQGAFQLISELMRWLTTLTGMPAVAMSPKAGAHGEHLRPARDPRRDRGAGRETAAHPGAGIRARHQSGDGGLRRLHRRRGAGDQERACRCRCAGGHARPDVCAIMLTNPNTCGLFEAAHHRDGDAGPQGGRLFLLRRRELQRHRGTACGRAISASTRCTSTCTRPSRRRMARRAGARGRWCCRSAWRLLRRCRCWCMTETNSA